MTEVQRYEPGTTNSLEAWADQAKAAAHIARAMAPTPWVPSSLRVAGDLERTTANVAAAVLTGFELGLKPMAALRSIDVINGTPALRAVALRALVQQAGHEMWLVESTKTQAVMRGRRAGESNVQESKWTIERARDLGLTTRDQWKKQPAAMLVARATAELCRLIASDVILGLAYAAEELDDPEGVETPALPRGAGPRSGGRLEWRWSRVPTKPLLQPPWNLPRSMSRSTTPPTRGQPRTTAALSPPRTPVAASKPPTCRCPATTRPRPPQTRRWSHPRHRRTHPCRTSSMPPSGDSS